MRLLAAAFTYRFSERESLALSADCTPRLPAGASLPQAASRAGYGKIPIGCLRTDAPFPPKKQTVLGTKKPSTAYFFAGRPRLTKVVKHHCVGLLTA